jgi:hypothetical protein
MDGQTNILKKEKITNSGIAIPEGILVFYLFTQKPFIFRSRITHFFHSSTSIDESEAMV